jgi:hypothetical protein
MTLLTGEIKRLQEREPSSEEVIVMSIWVAFGSKLEGGW